MLLSKAPVRKQAQRPEKKKHEPAQDTVAQPTQSQHSDVQPQTTGKSSSAKLMLYIFICITLVFLFIPKPQLITYEKLGMVSTSVYLPELLGGPSLVDSSLHVQSIIEGDSLYLCQDITQANTCQKYQIVKQDGFISALSHLISS
ncbi:hypothetical protein AAEU32_03090 [Pseudoalteromonas sp. SSDWG2]|uniref:hypothetical protein n=1 Tax=Pseudoalteromonas sp. SSDWG2 TaxID=3139391 RepID=UPI003BABD4B6